MQKIEQKKPELPKEEKLSVIPAMMVSTDEGKQNTRYLKSGAVVAAYVRGSIPAIIGAAVAYKLATPLVEDLMDYTRSNRKLRTYDDDVDVVSAAYPPRKFLKLKSEIAPDYRCERQFAKYLKVPHLPNFIMYKIIWEHIRITGTREYTGKCYVKRHHVRRLLSVAEKEVFIRFIMSLGNMDTNDVLQVQS
jgi:hypothetical protein